MGSYYSKINEVESSGKNWLIRLYKRAKEYGWSSSKINNDWLEYRKTIKIDKYPRYVSSYLTGVRDCLAAQIQYDDLEFCYIIDGKKYSINKDSDLYYEKHGISVCDLHKLASHSGHYWKVAGNAYYVSEVTD